MLKSILISILLLYANIFSQVSSIVSLDKNNVWIYENKKNTTIRELSTGIVKSSVNESYYSVYKIKGDTTILGKKVKIMEINNYTNNSDKKSYDYWFADESLFQMGDPLKTYFNNNLKSDSTWNWSSMGGYSGDGSRKIIFSFIIDSWYKSNELSNNVNSIDGFSEETIVAIQKYGLYRYSLHIVSNDHYVTQLGKETQIEKNLVGAKIEDQQFGITESDIIPSDLLVYQNYPNPFNNTTTIRFAVKDNSVIVLDIFNALGQIVYNAQKNADKLGFYEFNVVLSKNPSGIYFYRIRNSNGQSITKKMVLVK
jgi:hypothetical protein